MKYSLRFLISIILVFFICLAGNLVFKYCCLTYYNQFQKTNTIYSKQINADYIFLGSSRMYNTLNPKLVEHELGGSAYNLGMPAANINEILLLFQSYLKRNKKPALAVFSLDIFSLNDEKSFGFYPTYIYQAKDSDVAANLRNDGVHTWLHSYIPLFTTIEMDDYYRGVLIKVLTRQQELLPGDYHYKGYASNTLATIQSETPVSMHKAPITTTGINKLRKIMEICREMDVPALFTYAPEYKWNNLRNITNADSLMNLYHSTAQEYGFIFLRQDNLPMCQNPALFANAGHVNRIGADIYSDILAKQIRQHFPQIVKK
jgi:hypothetical protein